MKERMKNYPASLEIDYLGRSDRLSTLFRLFMAVPILIILALIVGPPDNQDVANAAKDISTIGFLFVPTLLMILFRKKYPKWWFDWNLSLTKFTVRVLSYILLLRDEYPSTDDEQAIYIEIKYPNSETDLNRWSPLIKWFLVIPHIIVLSLLFVIIFLCTIIAWFSIMFTENYPKGLFNLVVGFLRWSLRVAAYAFLLTTDKYPPFGFEE